VVWHVLVLDVAERRFPRREGLFAVAESCIAVAAELRMRAFQAGAITVPALADSPRSKALLP
jgi:hypothetical protein